MNKYGHERFTSLLKIQENNKCFDCGKNHVEWCSINNSIFLCTECAGEHRSFGMNISFIKSITLDYWKDNLILSIELGGNKSLKQLLNIYEISFINLKYEKKKQIYESSVLTSYRLLLNYLKLGEKSKEIEFPNKLNKLKSGEYSSNDNDGIIYNTFISQFKLKNSNEKFSNKNIEQNIDDSNLSLINQLNSWNDSLGNKIVEDKSKSKSNTCGFSLKENKEINKDKIDNSPQKIQSFQNYINNQNLSLNNQLKEDSQVKVQYDYSKLSVNPNLFNKTAKDGLSKLLLGKK